LEVLQEKSLMNKRLSGYIIKIKYVKQTMNIYQKLWNKKITILSFKRPPYVCGYYLSLAFSALVLFLEWECENKWNLFKFISVALSHNFFSELTANVLKSLSLREKCWSIAKQILFIAFSSILIMKNFDCDDEIYIFVKYISLIVKKLNRWFICQK